VSQLAAMATAMNAAPILDLRAMFMDAPDRDKLNQPDSTREWNVDFLTSGCSFLSALHHDADDLK
jgi:hypothetical protein